MNHRQGVVNVVEGVAELWVALLDEVIEAELRALLLKAFNFRVFLQKRNKSRSFDELKANSACTKYERPWRESR